MKLAIVPALALAAAGGAALMASPASASPEVGQQARGSYPSHSAMPDAKYGAHGGHGDHGDHGDHSDHHGTDGDVCNFYQFFPGTNILSGQVLNDAVDASVDVVVQLIALLGVTADTGDSAIVDTGCV